MDKEGLIEFALGRYGAEPEHLWKRYPEYFVLRHPVSGKWFAVVMKVPAERLGLAGTEEKYIMDVKCGPILGGSFIGREGFLPAYHMNKKNWLTVLLDGSAPDDEAAALLDISFDLSK